MEPITLSLIAILLVLMYYVVWKEEVSDDCENLPPGSMGLPVIGNSLQFVRKKVAYFSEKHRQYGRVFKTNLFGKKIVRIYGSDNVRKVIQGENKIVQSSYPTSVQTLFGDQTISMSHGEAHKEKKTRLMKYLNPDFFHNHTPILARAISEHLQTWCKSPDINLHRECHKMFMELAARFLINIEISSDEVQRVTDQLEIACNNIFCLPFNIPGFGFYKALKAKQRLREIIASSINSSANNNESSDDLCSVLQGLGATDGGVEKNTVLLDGIIDLLFSGSETVTSAGFSLAYQLSKRPDVVDKIRKEIEQQGLLHSEETVCPTDLQKMTYVNAVVKETLRMLPPVGGAYRTVLETFDLDGYTIPRGWTVVFGIRETHNKDPNISNSMEFQPERWLNTNDKDKYVFMPFGGGLRVCPGQAYAKMVLKLFAVELCRTCSVSLKKDSDIILWPTPRPATPVIAAVTSL